MIDTKIELDPEKVYAAIMSGQDVLGKPNRYWRIALRDLAQEIADEASAEQYDEWGIEELGYDY